MPFLLRRNVKNWWRSFDPLAVLRHPFFYNKLYLYIYITTDDHDDHGIQTRIVFFLGLPSELVGQLLLIFRLPICLTLLINVQPTGVKHTSAPTNVDSNQSRLRISPRQPFKLAIIAAPRHTLWTYTFFKQDYRWREWSPLCHTHTCHRSMRLSCSKSVIPFSPPLLSKNRPSLSSFRRTAVVTVLSASVTFRLGRFLADYLHGGYPLCRVLDGGHGCSYLQTQSLYVTSNFTYLRLLSRAFSSRHFFDHYNMKNWSSSLAHK